MRCVLIFRSDGELTDNQLPLASPLLWPDSVPIPDGYEEVTVVHSDDSLPWYLPPFRVPCG